MNELVDLERFAGPDVALAEEAFLRMTPKIERFLHKYLASLLPRAEDREDVIAQAIAKLWQRRVGFQVQGLAAWWSYVGKTGRSFGLSKLREGGVDEVSDEIPIDERATVEVLAQFSDDRRRLYEAADRLWLCVDASIPPKERKRRLLAAQLVYFQGVSPREVGRHLGLRSNVLREEVDTWIASESTLLELAYHSLFWENSDLLAHLLQPTVPTELIDIAWWVSQVERRPKGKAPNGMSWDEVAVIVWKFQFGMNVDRIALRAPDLQIEFIESVLERCDQLLPCAEAARKLRNCLSAAWIRTHPLTNPGLWKRLVFQYSVHSGLPQKQILSCTQPAAEQVGHRITKGMLNVWLSNGRLFTQLARFAEEEGI